MGGQSESRYTVRAMPAVNGLATAGHQRAIDETALWKSRNFWADTDGLVSKRPGLRAYGQTLKEPNTGATGSTATAFLPFLDGYAGMIDTDATAGAIAIASAARGVLQVNAPIGTPGATQRSLAYAVTALPSTVEWSFRMQVRGVGLPSYNGTDTDPATFHFRVGAAASVTAEFSLFSGGLYYKAVTTGTYTLITGTEFAGLGGWNTIEVRRDGANILVYLNDALKAQIVGTLAYVPTLSGTSLFELRWDYADDAVETYGYTTYVSTPMYNDVADDAFIGQPIDALGEFQYDTRTGTLRRVLLAAAGSYIYHDTDLLQCWRPLYARRYRRTHFAPYRRSIVWTDYNGSGQSVLWTWNGTDTEPETLDDAPPVEIVVEHQGRLWGIRDHANPHRAYYTAYAQPNVWFAPSETSIETFDTALEAGYVPVPAKGGDRLTAIFGDYYGSVILWTRKTISKVDGFGVFSYQHAFLSQKTGCEDQNAITQVGNDLWFGSRQGAQSLVATQQYGDLQVQQPTLVLSNLWAPFGRSDLNVNRNALSSMVMDYNPSTGLVLIALPLYGSRYPSNIFAYNTLTQQCHGPGEFSDLRSMRTLECLSPLRDVVMCGDDSGRIGYMDHTWKIDFGDESAAITGLLESAVIDGRSLDPMFPRQVKTFKTLRLFFLLRGEWNLTVKWITHGQEAGPFQSQTVNQTVVRRAYVVDDEFRVDVSPDGNLPSSEEVLTLDIALDARGQGLVWQIETNSEFAPLGWELEFMAAGKEQE